MRKPLLIIAALCCCAAAQMQRYDSQATATTGQPGSVQLQAVLPGSTVYVCSGTAVGASTCRSPGTLPLFSDIAGTQPLPQPLIADQNGNFGFYAASGALYYTWTPPTGSIGVATTRNVTLGTANAYTFTIPTPEPYAPSPVAAVAVGTTGSTTYYYWVVSNFTVGNSAPSAAAVVTDAAATLSAYNFDQVSWPAVPNANTYDVLRTTTSTAPTGACACAVATAVSGTTQNDQSNSLNAYTVNTYAGNTAFTMTNVAVGPGESQLTFGADRGAKFAIDSINGATIEQLTATSPAITPTSIENVKYSDLYNWPTQTPGGSLTAATLSAITPAWTAIPPGVGSGGFGLVSVTNGSTALTRVSGSYFDTNWTNKSALIDGATVTIASCASDTACTLSSSYAGATNAADWAVIGEYTPIYISGGTGTAEAVAIAGVGATECGTGTALTICVIPANSHSGAFTIRSATAGIQEAANGLNGPGTVFTPTGSYNVYASAVMTASYQAWTGAAGQSSVLNTTVAGIGTLVMLNNSSSTIAGYNIVGSATTGHGIARIATANIYYQDSITENRCATGGSSTTSAVTYSGASTRAACVYDAGGLLDVINGNNGSYGGIGVEVVSATGGVAGPNNVVSVSNNNAYGNYADGYDIGGNLSVRFTHNTAESNSGWGAVVSGLGVDAANNYFESDTTGELEIEAMGGSAMGNSFQFSDPSSGYVVKLLLSGNDHLARGIKFDANYFEVVGTVSGMTAAIDVAGPGNTVNNNVFDAGTATAQTIPIGIKFESGSTVNAAGNEYGPGQGAGGAPTITDGIYDGTASLAWPLVSGLQQVTLYNNGGKGANQQGGNSASYGMTTNAVDVGTNGGICTLWKASGLATDGHLSCGDADQADPISLDSGAVLPSGESLTGAGTIDVTTLKQGGVAVALTASPIFTGAPRLPTYTVATLPSASTSGAGATVVVTDATSFTAGSCVGGGSDTVIATSTGSAWVCH